MCAGGKVTAEVQLTGEEGRGEEGKGEEGCGETEREGE